MNWYLEVLNKYAVFNGRARRMEYWMFCLVNMVIGIVLMFVEEAAGIAFESGYGVLTTLYGLGIILPSIAVGVRRLHDTDRTGWWILISLVPIIGAIVLLVFLVQEGQPTENQYGPNPKGPIVA